MAFSGLLEDFETLKTQNFLSAPLIAARAFESGGIWPPKRDFRTSFFKASFLGGLFRGVFSGVVIYPPPELKFF